MKSRIMWLILSFLMALSLVLASCGEKELEEEEEEIVVEEEEEEEEEEERGPPPTGNWWDKLGEPEYGGKLTFRASSVTAGDPHARTGFDYAEGEPLFCVDWLVDREVFPCTVEFTPQEYFAGVLVESWELTDPTTCIVHVRKGVHFHDRPPVNGRELTADDIASHYDWILGTGHGYTEPAPMAFVFSDMEKLIVEDKYTVVFKFKPPGGFRAFCQLLFGGASGLIDAEEVGKAGLGQDYKSVASTGPFIITDFVHNVSTTWIRNPNYWAYDERHPQNQLPYIDGYKELAIPDMSTALAAMRTGKIDYLEDRSLTWVQAESMRRTNPEIVTTWLPNMGTCLDMRCDTEPFTDINVRKALNMAIDRETIAKTHYGGVVEGTPVGLIAVESGWTTPYNQWPKNLQDEYSYNPDRARQLLADAGYPNGFETNVYASTDDDSELLQIIKSYLMDIGVDMTINVLDGPTWRSFGWSRKHDQMMTNDFCGMIFTPPNILTLRLASTDMNKCLNYDPTWEAFVTSLEGADEARSKEICIEADQYLLSQHWALQVFGVRVPVLKQPWIKGHSGERISYFSYYWARLWIDQELKESKGR